LPFKTIFLKNDYRFILRDGEMMSDNEVPENIKIFIFKNIHSVEQLEILLYLRKIEKGLTEQQISSELRSTSASVSNRLISLQEMNLIKKIGTEYKYAPETEELKQLIDLLDETYKLKRQTLLELIFSPLKKARHFAEAFIITKNSKKGD